MIEMYREKRLYLVRISSHLTASSARFLFKILIPVITRKVILDEGDIEQYDEGKRTYLLILCNSKLLDEIIDKIKFIVSNDDVTDVIVTDDSYKVDEMLKNFDYQYFDRMYRSRYLENTPFWYAQHNIDKMGKNSRYIDHQVVDRFDKKRSRNS